LAQVEKEISTAGPVGNLGCLLVIFLALTPSRLRKELTTDLQRKYSVIAPEKPVHRVKPGFWQLF
jgi:hypothetical protein